MTPPLICLDPGHGGGDPGAIGRLEDGLKSLEKDFSLVQSLVCESFIRAEGFRTMLTRRTDATLGLRKRCHLANNANADAFISVHWNASGAEEPEGTQVLHHKTSEGGRRLAELLLAEVGPLDREHERWEKTIAVPQDSFRGGMVPTVIGRTRMPAVILETEFASNPEELLRMLSTPHQIAVGKAVARAVVEWWTEPEGGDGT